MTKMQSLHEEVRGAKEIAAQKAARMQSASGGGRAGASGRCKWWWPGAEVDGRGVGGEGGEGTTESWESALRT